MELSSPSLHTVGTSPQRLDAREKVMGRATFITDLRVPGMVYTKLWRSPLPHARLRAIDTTAAASAPGVLAVLTAEDLADCDRFFGPAYKDQPILAIDRVRYADEPVVAVVAHSEREAAAGVALLEVELEELPAVTTLDEALAPAAPLLHENLRRPVTFGISPICIPSPALTSAIIFTTRVVTSSRALPRLTRASRTCSPFNGPSLLDGAACGYCAGRE